MEVKTKEIRMSLEGLLDMEEKAKIKFMNTLGRKVETFVPIDASEVKMYTCGPTVYGRAHIGNMRAYIFADVVRRILEYGGYRVKQVMNITDVGHLTSDADEGEDKLQKSAREQKTTAWDVSKRYTEQFLDDASKLNIQPVHVLCKATDHVLEQIELIRKLEKKGFVYLISDGVYYDTSKFPRYGELAKLDIKGLQAGQRIEMGEKRNKTDFALWKFSKPKEKRDMEWDSPWGKGFPGWHIECSAMSMKYLGETFDIHTGGIDHIPIHHTNEIAQSEGATEKRFVNYWLHSEFLVMSDQEKMSKSLGNVVNLGTLVERGVDPLAYRYLCLGAHYRKRILFGEEILKSASNSFDRLRRKVLELRTNASDFQSADENELGVRKYLKKFRESVFSDLNTPQALATMWDMLGDSKVLDSNKYNLLIDFDKVFGLGILDIKEDETSIPKDILALLNKREQYRNSKQWKEADKVRQQIFEGGYTIQDTATGPHLLKNDKKRI